MAHYLCIREELMQNVEKVMQSVILFSGERVGRFAVLVQSALIAYAYGASVVWASVRPHLQQSAVLRHRTITTDIEVIADGHESS